MKTGDIVKIFDYSRILEVTEDGLQHTGCETLEGKTWKVIDTDLKLPASEFYPGATKRFNDTMLQDTNNNSRVVFTCEKFLKVKTCPTCNRVM